MSDFSGDAEDFINNLHIDSQPSSNNNNNNKDYEPDLYKKWFRSSSQSGFLAIRPWYQALKMRIDIGKTSSEGKLLSSTAVFVDAIDFAAYLRSVANQTAVTNYPANSKLTLPTAEGFVSYGGATIDNKPVSRVFKAHYWQSDDTYDSSTFAWKCGHFAARKAESGAFIPDFKTALSTDFIKVTRQDACSISYLVDLALSSYAHSNHNWYQS